MYGNVWSSYSILTCVRLFFLSGAWVPRRYLKHLEETSTVGTLSMMIMMSRKPTRSVICSTNQELHVFDNDDDTFEIHEEYVVLKGESSLSSLYLYPVHYTSTWWLIPLSISVFFPNYKWINPTYPMCN